MRLWPLVPLAIAACATPSCLRLNYRARSVEQPITTARQEAVFGAGADLQSCLNILGAPLYVWRAARSRTALAWGWQEATSWGFSVSYSPHEYSPSASFSYDALASDLEGFVAWFDDQQQLIGTQRGKLRDLVASLQR